MISSRLLTMGAVCAALSHVALAETETLWTRITENETFGQRGWHGVCAAWGNKFLGTTTVEKPDGSIRAIVRCWNANGDTQWTYEYPDPGPEDYEVGHAVVSAPDDTVIFVGERGSSVSKLLLARLDSNGNELDREEVSYNFEFNSVDGAKVDSAGNLFVSVHHSTFMTSRFESFTSGFVSRWHRSGTWFRSFELLPNGNVALCGESSPGNTSNEGVFSMITNEGIDLSSSTFGNGSTYHTYDLAATPTGVTYALSNDDLVRVFSPTGVPLGFFPVSAPENYEGFIAYDGRSSTLYFAAENYLSGDLWLYGYSPVGVEKWVSTRNVDIAGQSVMLDVDKFGNAVALATVGQFASNYNIRAWGFNAKGQFQWTNETFDTPSSDEEADCMVIDDKLRMLVLGSTVDQSTDSHKAFAWRTAQAFATNPSSATIRLGRSVSGNMESMTQDDGDEYVVMKFIVPNQQVRPIVVEFDFDFPIDDVHPGNTDLRALLRQRADTVGLAEWIQLWDWTTQQWTASPNYSMSLLEQEWEIPFAPVGNFFEPGTTHVRARLAVGVVGPVSQNVFRLYVDQFQLRSDTR